MKNILDEYSFVNNILDGEIVWKGKPNTKNLFRIKGIHWNLFYTFSLGFFLFIITVYLESNREGIIEWAILSSLLIIFVIVFQFYCILLKLYQLIRLMNSKYIITTSHVFCIGRNEKIIFKEPLNIIYQIEPVELIKGKGNILLKIKLDRIASKTKKIKMKHKMTNPSQAIEAIDDYISVSKILLETRNNAMNTLD